MTVVRRRRCVLAVPGSSAKMAAKAASLPVDQVMLDLEDAIVASAKPQARRPVIESLLDLDWGGRIVSVRVNAVATTWFERDVLEVVAQAGGRIDTIVLPKVESASQVRTVALMLSRVEREHGLRHRIGIEPQIESARGLCVAHKIATADDRVESLTFGPADYAASVGAPVLTIGAADDDAQLSRYALSSIVAAAKATGRAVIDGPFGVLDDPEGLVRSASLARALGCDGKWAVHPSQIAPIQAVFTPTDEEMARARRISDRYAALGHSGSTGAVSYEGELVDAVSARLAAGILLRGGEVEPPRP